MPSVFGKDSKKKELIANLGEIYHKIEKEHQISPGDFPKLDKMQVRFKKGKKERTEALPWQNWSAVLSYRSDENTTLFLECCIKC